MMARQARKLGISIEPAKESKPRVQLTFDEKLVQARVKQAKALVERLTTISHNFGWNIGLCRLHTTDKRNDDYPNIKDYEAVPNAVMLWRDEFYHCCQPRVKTLGFIWDVEAMSEGQIITMVSGEDVES